MTPASCFLTYLYTHTQTDRHTDTDTHTHHRIKNNSKQGMVVAYTFNREAKAVGFL